MRPNSTTQTPARQHFWQGVKDTFPLLVGALPFGLIYGALGIASGLSPLATAAMSLVVFAGSAQFIAVSLLAVHTPVLVIALTTLVVNARHMLYSATLAPQLKGLSTRWLVPLGFWLTDESFVVAAKGFEQRTDLQDRKWYLLGSELAMYTNWFMATGLGILAGQAIADPASWGLDFALVVTFIGMLVPMVKGRPELLAVLVAGVTAVAAYGLPHRSGLLLAAVLGIAAGVLAERAWPRAEGQQA